MIMKKWPDDYTNWEGTSEDLVRVSNEVLALISADTRPMTLRSLRHYQNSEVISRGVKRGKSAYFDYKDLMSLVTAKLMANNNWNLNQAKQVLESMPQEMLAMNYQTSPSLSDQEQRAMEMIQNLTSPNRGEVKKIVSSYRSSPVGMPPPLSLFKSTSLGGGFASPQSDLSKILKEATQSFSNSGESTAPAKCSCEACSPDDVVGFNRRFIVCSICGNKRCPHAHNHLNACTNSNEVGQPGSSWEHVSPVSGSIGASAASAHQLQHVSLPLSQQKAMLQEIPMQVPWMKVQADFLQAMASTPEDREKACQDLQFILNTLQSK